MCSQWCGLERCERPVGRQHARSGAAALPAHTAPGPQAEGTEDAMRANSLSVHVLSGLNQRRESSGRTGYLATGVIGGSLGRAGLELHCLAES